MLLMYPTRSVSFNPFHPSSFLLFHVKNPSNSKFNRFNAFLFFPPIFFSLSLFLFSPSHIFTHTITTTHIFSSSLLYAIPSYALRNQNHAEISVLEKENRGEAQNEMIPARNLELLDCCANCSTNGDTFDWESDAIADSNSQISILDLNPFSKRMTSFSFKSITPMHHELDKGDQLLTFKFQMERLSASVKRELLFAQSSKT